MFNFRKFTDKDIEKELGKLEQRLMNEVETVTDAEAVKTTLGNLCLLSVLRKKYYDTIKEQ